MYIRNLLEPQDERLEQAARAILAAVYNPLTTQANWGDIDQLNRPSYDRLMRIAALAVANWTAQTPPGEVPAGYVQEVDSTIFNPTPSHRDPVRQ
jgi:hypothetical protein